MNLARWLLAAARRDGAAPALLRGNEFVSNYAEFARRSAAIAAWLESEHGVTVGDRVAIYATNSVEYLECLYGIWWCGAAAVPVNAKLHPREAAWIIGNARADVVLTDGHWDQALAEALVSSNYLSCQVIPMAAMVPAPRPRLTEPRVLTGEALAWLFYTSGTTGRPKGVKLSHANLVAMSLSYLADVDDVTSGDAALYAAPLSHGAGLYNFVHVLRGARHVVPSSGGFQADEVLDLAAQLRDVSMFAAPTMVRRLVSAARARVDPGDGIKTIVYGGGPMYRADIVDALTVLGDRFVQIYGQGESPMTVTTLSRADHAANEHVGWPSRLSSVGLPNSVVDVRVVRSDGSVAAATEPGEIEVAGPTVMSGYWEDEAATLAAFVGPWLKTGDVGYLNSDGYLTRSDRSKDVIISGGSNVYPREVEEVLLNHPAVSEVAVVGLPDPEWGEIVAACVVLHVGYGLVSDSELSTHCAESIARFKLPKRYERLAELPKNNNGKVLKSEIRQRVMSTSTGAVK